MTGRTSDSCFLNSLSHLVLSGGWLLPGKLAKMLLIDLLDFTRQLLETGVENDLVLSLVVFSLQYLLVNHEYWKYKLLNARATSGFNSHLLATSVYANMLKVLQVIKTCIISTLVPGKLGEKLYVIRTFELMEIEGLELAIGSALDILYTMLSKFSKEISSIPSVFHQAVLSPTTTPVPVFAAVTSLISYFRNPVLIFYRYSFFVLFFLCLKL
ncbi:hypothetical protein WN943_024987 [Citrus x changshan-huyou]